MPAEPAQSLPSTLAYKDRTCMMSLDSTTYARLYNNPILSQPVWTRLHFDAGVRTSRALKPTPPEPLFGQPIAHYGESDSLSGFVSNTKRVVYSPDLTFKTGHLKFEGQVSVNQLRPLQLRRFKQKEPMEYYIAIRPDTESTNQTLRMLGTYSTDIESAKKSNTFIPNGCPGGPPMYHADVRLTSSLDLSTRPPGFGRPRSM